MGTPFEVQGLKILKGEIAAILNLDHIAASLRRVMLTLEHASFVLLILIS